MTRDKLPRGRFAPPDPARATSNQLLFRRQFILGPRFADQFSSWQKVKLGGDLHLTVHPDLAIYRRHVPEGSITLLGYILDPLRPDANDGQILDDLLGQLRARRSLHDFFRHTYGLGGRWILIVNNNRQTGLFSDALGQRQICYTDPAMARERWYASQPGIIAETLNLQMSNDILGAFMQSYAGNDQQYWWPYDLTPYKEIKHLPPNHYLNLETGLRARYWPDAALDDVPLDEGVRRCSATLTGLMQSAYNRFEIALPLTSGWDSRMLLAASRPFKDRTFYFSMKYWNLTDKTHDIRVPGKLLAKLRLQHHVIECPASMEEGFRKLYTRNVTTAREVYGSIAQGLYEQYPGNRVCMKGNASATVKSVYRSPERHGTTVTGAELAEKAGMKAGSFGAQSLENWLHDAAPSCFNVNPLNLFYWEQRMGNWQAMSALEWDMVQEVFQPFNCRTLLADLLSVDERLRAPPDYKLFRELILGLWPEALCEPINPPDRAPLPTRAYRKMLRTIKRFVSPRSATPS